LVGRERERIRLGGGASVSCKTGRVAAEIAGCGKLKA